MSTSRPQLINTQDCCLVIIDAQQRLLPAIWENQRVQENLVRLAQFSRIVSLPVVLSLQQKLGDTIEPLAQALPGAPAVSKLSFDCFGEETFVQHLESLGRGTLLIAGVEAHICVTQTALTGLDRGYRVQVVSDAVSSRDPRNLEVALRRLEAAGVELTSTEMLIYELLRRAGTPEFKQVLPLVK